MTINGVDRATQARLVMALAERALIAARYATTMDERLSELTQVTAATATIKSIADRKFTKAD